MLGQMFFNRFEYWRQESNVEAIRQQLVKCFRCFRGRLFSEMLSGILAMGPRWFVDGRGMLKTLAVARALDLFGQQMSWKRVDLRD